jgi:hypothetical protein
MRFKSTHESPTFYSHFGMRRSTRPRLTRDVIARWFIVDFKRDRWRQVGEESRHRV